MSNFSFLSETFSLDDYIIYTKKLFVKSVLLFLRKLFNVDIRHILQLKTLVITKNKSEKYSLRNTFIICKDKNLTFYKYREILHATYTITHILGLDWGNRKIFSILKPPRLPEIAILISNKHSHYELVTVLKSITHRCTSNTDCNRTMLPEGMIVDLLRLHIDTEQVIENVQSDNNDFPM